ncbi:MAG: efflux RND transporter periplasmic adaptor subunit [Nitrospiraceae bacterium]|nr:efflux RND transporter periplasmic adaptor subunit [Nitrospiraceae bacterium]
MTNTPIRDADVSVLTLPREDPPPTRQPQSWLRWLTAGVAAAFLLVALYWYVPRSSALPEVDTATVRLAGGHLPTSPLTASGYVVAQRQASVASKGTGRLEYLGVTVGSHVATGDVIARVQQDDVQAIQHQARARLDVAKAELRDAQLSYARAKALLPNQFISQAEFDTTSTRLRRAEAAVRSSSAAIAAAEADVQTANEMLENTLIRSPFDGTVLKKFAEIGEVVAPMAGSTGSRGAVVLIADMTSLAVETEISESSITQIAKGQLADITLDAVQGKHYPATVEQIVPTADRSKGTVLAKVRFVELDDRVLPEMSAKVSFTPVAQPHDSAQPRLFVPSSALVQKNGRLALYMLEDETVQEVSVEVVSKSGGDSEVHGRLTASAQVILSRPGESIDPAH